MVDGPLTDSTPRRRLALFHDPPCCCVCAPPASSNPACHRPPIVRRAAANWIHEIKHDGFRLMARRDGAGVRLLTRNGHDWTPRYPADLRGGEPARGALVPDRRRGGGLRRRWPPDVPEAACAASTTRTCSCSPSTCWSLTARTCGASRSRRARRRSRACCGHAVAGLHLQRALRRIRATSSSAHACKMGLEGIVSKRLGSRVRLWADPQLAQVQEPGRAGGEAGGRRGLEGRAR